ncbi:MAG: hypothetical protein ACRERC_19135, partial [Candidatus Binatia bacterium]
RRRGTGALHVLLTLGMLGCASAVRQYDLIDRPMTCDDANRTAYRTLQAMRFTVGEFQPAEPGRPGVMRGQRTTKEDHRSVTVRITCTATGATVDATEDGAWLEQMEIKRSFHHAFTNIVSMRAAQEELDAKVVAGTAPASQQRRDVKVLVEPLRGQAGRIDFPFDIAAAGILPVRIDITNLTPQTYTLVPTELQLTTPARERVAALTPAAAAAQIAAARVDGKPLTVLSPTAIAGVLDGKQFSATSIAPGAQQRGFLYFPLAEYVSARLVLTDSESGEDEGVRVEF